MAIFSTKLTRHRITLSPFSAEQMSAIGAVMADTIVTRIKSATDARDSPARPLTEKYAARKIAKGRGIGRFPIRNWVFGDHTLRTVQAKSASEDRVTVGFTSQRAIQVVNGIARYGQMWGTSPKDMEVFYALIVATLKQKRFVQIVKTSEKVA